ncbi:MAG: phage BR0599 family protein, partial [Alphaproteobacteria bacterium]|nr:phage BR0599 family protein [Alphaproteobacteria bacterium]
SSAWRSTATVVAIDDPYRLVVSGLGSFAEGWFSFGSGQWNSGRRSGGRDGILGHARGGGSDVLAFATRVGDWAEPGDTLTVTAGCDRRFATCQGKFGNAVNFRGFPHIPGSDYVLRHPRNGDALDGRAVVR